MLKGPVAHDWLIGEVENKRVLIHRQLSKKFLLSKQYLVNAGGDFGDQSFASGESSLDLAEAKRDIAELSAIDAALTAISEGTYGLCERCGLGIEPRRLEAVPQATTCAVCAAVPESPTA